MNVTVKWLDKGNRRYVGSGVFSGDVSEERRKANANGQKPRAVIVTCSDSRVVPEAVFHAG